MISWKATAIGMASITPIVKGEGPLEVPKPQIPLRNSKEPTLSARLTLLSDVGLIQLLLAPIIISERLDGGLGMAIVLPAADVGVGICRP